MVHPNDKVIWVVLQLRPRRHVDLLREDFFKRNRRRVTELHQAPAALRVDDHIHVAAHQHACGHPDELDVAPVDRCLGFQLVSPGASDMFTQQLRNVEQHGRTLHASGQLQYRSAGVAAASSRPGTSAA